VAPTATVAPTDAPVLKPTVSGLTWPALLNADKPYQPVNTATWSLQIGGLVSEPLTYTLQQLRDFPKITQNRRWITAMGWTVRAPWEGVLLQHLLDKVRPTANATHILQEDVQGNQEYLPLKEALNQRLLLVYGVNNKPLDFLHGGPVQLMVFNRYHYKGLGQLAKITLVSEEDPTVAVASEQQGYSRSGDIVPMMMYAWDLRTSKPIKHSGEVTDY
jgi:DMSO/TMAO reductase YedYZ molybdopterin-dependent catalytic subunit